LEVTVEDIENFFVENTFSVETEARYRRALGDILAVVDGLEQLTAAELKAYLFGRGWGSSTRWVNCAAVRKYLRWRYGDDHPALKLKIRRDETAPQRSLDADQALALLASFDLLTVRGVRDLAICSLMLDSGLRVSEVCSLDVARLYVDKGSIDVRVKGGRWRAALFSENTGFYLGHWVAIRAGCRGAEGPALFLGIGGLKPGSRMTRGGLALTVRRWGERIGIRLSPHDLRRTFAVLSTEAGAPSRVLQLAGRWANITMVERYTRNVSQRAFAPYFPVAHLVHHG
jgi:site-specific recombinase XerC